METGNMFFISHSSKDSEQALALYQLLLDNLTFDNPLLKLVPFSDQWSVLLIGFLAGGMLVGVCGSAISMSKYLKQEGSERV